MTLGRRGRQQIEFIDTAVEAAKHARRSKEARVGHLLRIISRTIIDPPQSCPPLPQSIEEFQSQLPPGVRVRRSLPRTVRAVHLTDGVAVLFTTQASLEDRAHQLFIPEEGAVHYERMAFNIDAQAIGSQSLKLDGMSELVDNEQVPYDLSYCAGGLAVETLCAWPHAFRKI